MAYLKGDGYQSGEFVDVIHFMQEDMTRFHKSEKKSKHLLKNMLVISDLFSTDI